jgi:cytoskeletal protein CcmA (bactofilin family)
MLPNFKRSESEPPKITPGLTPLSAGSTPPGQARPLGLARGAERNTPSVIGPDLTINGNLVSKGEVQIDGEVQGDIHGTYVVIGEKARITGGIVAEEIVVRGHVMGSVRGKRVMLQSSSHVEGDIFHQALAIEQGAFFEGKSRRSDDPLAEAARPEIPGLNGTSLG